MNQRVNINTDFENRITTNVQKKSDRFVKPENLLKSGKEKGGGEKNEGKREKNDGVKKIG